MTDAPRDGNFVPTRLAVLNTDTTQGQNLVPIRVTTGGAILVDEVSSISFTMQPIDPRDQNYVNVWCFEGTDGSVYPAVATVDGELLVDT